MNNEFRIYLRALELDDYKKSIKWRNDDDIWSTVVGSKYFVSSVYEKKWVEDSIFNTQKDLKLAICLKENDEYIGNIYLTDIDYKNKNAGYSIMIGEKHYWGQGLAKEAILLILKYAFMDLGLIRVQARYLNNNLRSINTAKKCGFKEEGLLRKAVFKNGDYQDIKIMSIIRDDFNQLYNK